jgi:hypothetical protein
MAKTEPVEPPASRPEGTYEVRAPETAGRSSPEDSAVVFLIYASTALAECRYNIVETTAVGSPTVVVEEEPSGESWQPNPDVARALANVIVFRPELEDPSDEDLESYGRNA